MSDDLELEEPDEYVCPGEDECHDDECERREQYDVEMEVEVYAFDVWAHSQEEAERLAEEMALDQIELNQNAWVFVYKHETTTGKLLGDNETSSGAL